ncbi:hypothetical protein DTO195F2_186 [Paecilomyces variotii]|nr:hypothetical protein DTO195F2_186 [Paecilomyces variotii]
MPRPMHKTTALPRTLRDELGIKDTYGEKKRRRNNGPASRKERRKEERAQKKGRHVPPHVNRRQLHHEDDDEGTDFGGSDFGSNESQSEEEEDRSTKSKPTKSTKQPKSILKKSKKRDVSNEEDEDGPAEPKLPKAVKEKLEQDDAEIAALEKRLGIKGKKLPKSFQEDGLDELLGDLANGSDMESKKCKREADDWLQMKRRKARGLASDEEDDESDSDLGSDDGLSDLMDGLDEDEEEDEDDVDLNESEDGIEEDEESGSDDEDGDFEGFDEEEEEEEEAPRKKVRENPYVAPVSNGESKQKYIPPSLRAPAASESESLTRLRRQAQGHLNKLSEANLVSILGEIEKLYREYPRQNVTSTLTTLLLNLLCERSVMQDTFVILHAGFIAAIYKVVGMDFGAEIVQKLVETFDKGGDERGAFEGKEAINLMSLLSQLYNFQVVGSTLVFDYVRMFLEKITESNTELLLKIIRNSGPQLRQDDPSSLKDIVLLIQPAIAQVGEESLSVRTKFMIDTITDLKNNRMKTGVAASALSSEHITKMRKILGSLNNSRTIRATEPIRISRMDILNSSKKGKWWLVGASWKDDPLEAARQELGSLPRNEAPVEDSDGEPDLVSIAKAHRMNTDVRRSIFVAIMSATDYRDAHVRLLKLRLKRTQELEIPRVLIHCAMEEQAHNPYYTLIARRICGELGRRIKVSFMFSLWDIFKKMGEQGDLDEDEDDNFGADEEDNKLETKSVVNLAKMYGSLVADGSLTLGILKNLNFAYLQPKTSMFVELLIITIIQQSQKQKQKSKKKDGEEDARNEKPLMEVFLRTRDTPQVVKGLIYFIRKVVAKTDIVPTDKERKLVKWGCKVAVDALKIVSDGESALDA